jgi:ribonuclease J
MNLTIHRGAHEIGGSCVEVSSEAGRLILDLGMPLVSQGKDGTEPFDMRPHRDSSGPELVAAGVLPYIPGLYAWDSPEVTAVLISHAHQDHYAFTHHVHPEIPVWCSRETHGILKASDLFVPNAKLPHNIHTFEKSWQKHAIGNFTVTPHPLDHSSTGGVALEVTDGEKRICYSGDLRAHGRNPKLFQNMLNHPPRNVDAFLLEGTMMSRPSAQEYPTEKAVEEKLTRIFAAQKDLAFLFCSGQNVDRLLSVYEAVKQAGKARPDFLFVIDLYTAFVLLQLYDAGRNPGLQFWSPRVKVYYWPNHYKTLRQQGTTHAGFLKKVCDHRIQLDDALQSGAPRVMLARDNSQFDILRKHLERGRKPEMIWSQWQGYLTGQTRVERFCDERNLTLHKIHTSGHATLPDLQSLVAAVNPGTVIPIHTFEGDKYADAFPHVTRLDDGQTLSL